MKNKHFHVAYICILAIAFQTTLTLADNDFNYGKEWHQFDNGGRLAWVWGFYEGQRIILEDLEIKDDSKTKYIISRKDIDIIRNIMTQYYNDSANTYIPWKYMTYVAKMKLTGKSKNDIEKELEMLRAYADWLRK
jgi:hypothetical protein